MVKRMREGGQNKEDIRKRKGRKGQDKEERRRREAKKGREKEESKRKLNINEEIRRGGNVSDNQ